MINPADTQTIAQMQTDVDRDRAHAKYLLASCAKREQLIAEKVEELGITWQATEPGADVYRSTVTAIVDRADTATIQPNLYCCVCGEPIERRDTEWLHHYGLGYVDRGFPFHDADHYREDLDR